MTKSQDCRRSTGWTSRRRLGFTLLEIMTSVTLALMLMYAVARIFSHVGGAMNETTSIMEMTNSLRNATHRLTSDLEALSLTPSAPQNSRDNKGYLCYVEGMGAPFRKIKANRFPFSVADIALDSERFQRSNDPDDYVDNTVGDLDDVLSFTAKAPSGQSFRGRYIQPEYDGAMNIIGATPSTFDSEYAEIVWFVRGTTLYRRVLPLLSNEQLQESFLALEYASSVVSTEEAPNDLYDVAAGNIEQGYGFFRFYDVSVHLGSNGRLVANTLADLTNRENRYFYWNSCGIHLNPTNTSVTRGPWSLHGNNDAWYWLRMATLQESAAPNFRAGAPFGSSKYAIDNVDGSEFPRRIQRPGDGMYVSTDGTRSWFGLDQELSLVVNAGDTPLATGVHQSFDLPEVQEDDGTRYPFIDFWNFPNVWDQVNSETGDLNITAADYDENMDNPDLMFNQDVVLTNVISFNVRVWDPNRSAFVDLGSGVVPPDSVDYIDPINPNDLRSYGRYGDPNSPYMGLYLPCVYDTWSEQYQRDLYTASDFLGTGLTSPDSTLTSIASNGDVASADLYDYKPPYDVPLQSMQVEIRVFDPRSKTIRNSTFNVDFSRL